MTGVTSDVPPVRAGSGRDNQLVKLTGGLDVYGSVSLATGPAR